MTDQSCAGTRTGGIDQMETYRSLKIVPMIRGSNDVSMDVYDVEGQAIQVYIGTSAPPSKSWGLASVYKFSTRHESAVGNYNVLLYGIL